jgi:hypothetical protein
MPSGKTYLFHQIDVDNYPGWKIVHLYDLKAASKLVSEPLSKIIRPVIIILCALAGGIYFLSLSPCKPGNREAPQCGTGASKKRRAIPLTLPSYASHASFHR